MKQRKWLWLSGAVAVAFTVGVLAYTQLGKASNPDGVTPVGARVKDVGKPKVEVLARYIRESCLPCAVTALQSRQHRCSLHEVRSGANYVEYMHG